MLSKRVAPCLNRGRELERLADVVDSRGDRGLVAVTERAGGRVRILHYAPSLPPFYEAELTHCHRFESVPSNKGVDEH